MKQSEMILLHTARKCHALRAMVIGINTGIPENVITETSGHKGLCGVRAHFIIVQQQAITATINNTVSRACSIIMSSCKLLLPNMVILMLTPGK